MENLTQTSELTVKCDSCNRDNHRAVKQHQGFKKAILSVFWCDYCGSVQALRYNFDKDNNPFILHRIEPALVLIPKKPDQGITVRCKPKNNR